MKKYIAFIFLTIGLPAMAQVTQEIDAINPRKIHQSEASETVIARGELVCSPDDGILYLGDGVNAGGHAIGFSVLITNQSYLGYLAYLWGNHSTGYVCSGNISLTNASRLTINSGGVYGYSSNLQQDVGLIIAEGDYYRLDNIYKINFSSLGAYIDQYASFYYNDVKVLSSEERKNI